MFSSTCFVDLALTFRCPIHFEFLIVYGVRENQGDVLKVQTRCHDSPCLKFSTGFSLLLGQSPHSSPQGLLFSHPSHPPPAPLLCCSHQFSSAAAALARCLLTVLTCKLLPASVFLPCYSLYLNTGYLVASHFSGLSSKVCLLQENLCWQLYVK